MQAAIVGGLLSGGVVLLGVILEQHLTKRREREARIQEIARRLVIEIGKLEALLKRAPSEVDAGRLNEIDERVQALALEVRLLSLKRRHYHELTNAIDELLVNQFAARERRADGIPMEVLETLGGAAINDVVFPNAPHLGDRIRDRVKRGLPILGRES
jgi:hypothetical protein